MSTAAPPAFPPIPGSEPLIRNVETAPAYWLADVLWIVLVDGNDTGGRFSLMEQLLPKGSGPGPHKHTWSDETFYMLDGGYTPASLEALIVELATPATTRTLPPKGAAAPPQMNPELLRRYGMDVLPGPDPLRPDAR